MGCGSDSKSVLRHKAPGNLGAQAGTLPDDVVLSMGTESGDEFHEEAECLFDWPSVAGEGGSDDCAGNRHGLEGQLEQWRVQHAESLRAPDGWLTLVGLA